MKINNNYSSFSLLDHLNGLYGQVRTFAKVNGCYNSLKHAHTLKHLLLEFKRMDVFSGRLEIVVCML